MTKKKEIAIILALVVIASVIILINTYKPINTEDNFLSFRMYDKDKNIIPANSLSIVEGIPGVAFIDITITVTNTGTTLLDCNIISLSPTAFDNAVVPRESKTLPVSPSKVSWTSDLIDVVPLEALSQPIDFTATVRCTYNTGTEIITLGDQQGTLPLTVINEGGAQGFNVNLALGGDPATFCGDSASGGGCDADESCSTCPIDCCTTTNVKFRASDSFYVSGSGVAFDPSATCDGLTDLTGFGYRTRSTLFPESCDNRLSGYVYQYDVKGGWLTGGHNPKLYYDNDNPLNPVRVCDEQTDGKTQYTTYGEAEYVADTPLLIPTSLDSGKEVSC